MCPPPARKPALEKAGVPARVHLAITDLGIEKQPPEGQMVLGGKRVVEHVKGALARRQA